MVLLPIKTFNPEIDSIVVTRGDTKKISTTIVDGADNPVDLTGGVITLTVKTDWGGLDKNIVFQQVATLIDAINGDIEFILSSIDTKNIKKGIYVYDIEINLSGEIITINNPKPFIVVEDVTGD